MNEKLLRWWFSSQFEGGEYTFAAKDAVAFLEAVSEKGSPSESALREFFGKLFSIEVNKEPRDTYNFCVFEVLGHNAPPTPVKEIEETHTFYDWLVSMLRFVDKKYKILENKERVLETEGFGFRFYESFEGSWDFLFYVGYDEEYGVEHEFYMGYPDDELDSPEYNVCKVLYKHPTITLEEALS